MNMLRTVAQSTTSIPAKGGRYTPPAGEIADLIAAKREHLPIWTRDITPQRAQALRKQLAISERALAPAHPAVIKSWLARLSPMVTNPPDPNGKILQVICEVCSDIPDGAWTPESRMAWVRQPRRNGIAVGSFWPSPAEIYHHLNDFGQKLRDEVAILRNLIALAEAPKALEPSKPDADEIDRRKSVIAALRNELKSPENQQKPVKKARTETPDMVG